ncbi:hypothetical protein ACU61A_41895, partial [Pseudonocardia sichuanensis]
PRAVADQFDPAQARSSRSLLILPRAALGVSDQLHRSSDSPVELGDGGDDLREVLGERSLLAGLQRHRVTAAVSDAAIS